MTFDAKRQKKLRHQNHENTSRSSLTEGAELPETGSVPCSPICHTLALSIRSWQLSRQRIPLFFCHVLITHVNCVSHQVFTLGPGVSFWGRSVKSELHLLGQNVEFLPNQFLFIQICPTTMFNSCPFLTLRVYSVLGGQRSRQAACPPRCVQLHGDRTDLPGRGTGRGGISMK